MFIIYNLILTLLMPLWVPWMYFRSSRRAEAPNWRERSGNYEGTIPPKDKKVRRIWVHAVSVGEVIAARPFLKELRRTLPTHEIVLTVTTSSGHQTARETMEGLYEYLVYFPIDIPKFMLRAMQRVRPEIAIIMETELWFNFLWAAKTFDVTTMVVNGRMSDRAYKRTKNIAFFYKALFKDVDRNLVQSEMDRERFESLGARNVQVLGNTKFDEASSPTEVSAAEWQERLGIPDEKQVVVVGSTRSEMEEELVVSSFFQLENVVYVHAPRHLETTGRIVELFKKHAGSSGKTIGLRSENATADYLVLDTFGELSSVYSVADVAVIGGGFDKLGGQNLIQPFAFGKPVLHGPNMMNFRTVSEAGVKAGASMICANSAELVGALRMLLGDAEKRATMGAEAKKLVAANIGASKRYADAVVAEVK